MAARLHLQGESRHVVDALWAAVTFQVTLEPHVVEQLLGRFQQTLHTAPLETLMRMAYCLARYTDVTDEDVPNCDQIFR